jgi:putative FmdB family regulatory protein
VTIFGLGNDGPLRGQRYPLEACASIIPTAFSALREQNMPFYEYECSACKFYVEALQKISEPALRKCPSCKKQTLKRLVSAPVFRLKGAGWYETDFKSDKEGKRNLAGQEEAAAPSTEEAKAQPQPDAKAETVKTEDTKAPAAEPKRPSVARTSSAASAKRPSKSASSPKSKPKAKAKPARKKRR